MARSAKAVPAQRRNFFHKMQLKMFSIPALDPGEGTEEMNRFLRAHRVLSVEKRLVGADASAFWSVCVEYLDRAYGAAAEAIAGRPRRRWTTKKCSTRRTSRSLPGCARCARRYRSGRRCRPTRSSQMNNIGVRVARARPSPVQCKARGRPGCRPVPLRRLSGGAVKEKRRARCQ